MRIRDRLVRRVTVAVLAEAGVPVRQGVDGSYGALVAACRRLERSMPPAQLTAAGIRVVHRVLPPRMRRLARLMIHNDRIAGWIAVRVVPRAVRWLVGPVSRTDRATTARIHRCRFLLETGSPTLCYRFCKAPSERVFTDQLNIAMRMTPDLSDGSCTLTFGPRARTLSTR